MKNKGNCTKKRTYNTYRLNKTNLFKREEKKKIQQPTTL